MKNQPVAAVETYYNGYKFRSRAEARWAVLFDSLAIKYEYEPEKFQCGEDRYIPDFFLPRMNFDPQTDSYRGVYFEVKGPYPDQLEIGKACWLHEITNKVCYIFHGSSFDGGGGLCCWPRSSGGDPVSHVGVQQCPLCGEILLCFVPRGDDRDELSIQHPCLEECVVAKQFDVDHGFLDWQDLTSVKLKNPTSSPMLALAFQTAKSVRFEDEKHLSEIKGIVAAIRTLREQKVWCFPEVKASIAQIAMELRKRPSCPHYDGEPYYVPHLHHLRAKVEGPCPCYSCEYVRTHEGRSTT